MDLRRLSLVGIALLAVLTLAASPALAQKRPNVVMLMSDDVGWGDYGVYYGGAALGHPTPNIDRLAKEGAMFTSWYGQASCTAGRASFMTGRIPVRTALSVVVVPGDPNGLDADTPTIAEFYKKNGYQTYFSGKWHLGDVEKFYPINHGFDEMKQFAAYYPGVYAYEDTAPNAHPLFPKYNKEYWDMYQKVVNLYEWEGTAGKPAVKGNNGAVITLENLADFDVRQTDSAVAYIKQHAKDGKPFFMSVNFMGMHQPTSPNKAFVGKSRLGNYSDKMMEMDANIGRIMDAIRAEAPDTIVIHTADNGAWQDAWPDAGTNPFRGEKGTGFEGAFRVPGIMWAPGRIPAGQVLHEMMSHMDVWPTTATMVGLTPPPHGEWKDNNGKPIYFDGIDNTRLRHGQGAAFGARWVDLHRRREVPGHACRRRWRPGESRSEDRVEAPLHVEGHLAGPGAEPRRHRFDLQPHHGPVREVRHDVQRRGGDAQPDHVAGPLRGHGQWLGHLAPGHSALGVQQVHRPVSEQEAIPGRSFERHDPESAEPGEPAALRSDQGAEDHRSALGAHSISRVGLGGRGPRRAPAKRTRAGRRSLSRRRAAALPSKA